MATPTGFNPGVCGKRPKLKEFFAERQRLTTNKKGRETSMSLALGLVSEIRLLPSTRSRYLPSMVTAAITGAVASGPFTKSICLITSCFLGLTLK